MPLPERELIERIRRRAASSAPRKGAVSSVSLVTGIGDDCAVLRLPRGNYALLTTDLSIEGVHFRREWHPPESVGHRCLARGLSDIAAMGGRPAAAFLSLGLPARTSQAWVDRFLSGFLGLARQHRVTLAGGDASSSPEGVLADITVLGSAPAGCAVLRSGARPEDQIYVTGGLGGAAAALERIRRLNPKRPLTARLAKSAALAAHFFPSPRVALGQRLRGCASAMIDLSDGVSTDLHHICRASTVGAVIEAKLLPLVEIAGQPVPLELALHGGEDYELLFTAPVGTRIPRAIAGVPVTRIGEIVRGTKLTLVDANGKAAPLAPLGWEHFR